MAFSSELGSGVANSNDTDNSTVRALGKDLGRDLGTGAFEGLCRVPREEVPAKVLAKVPTLFSYENRGPN